MTTATQKALPYAFRTDQYPRCNPLVRLGEWSAAFNDALEKADRIFRLLIGLLIATTNGLLLRGKEVSSTLSGWQDRIALARSFSGALRGIPEFFKLITLKTVWRQKETILIVESAKPENATPSRGVQGKSTHAIHVKKEILFPEEEGGRPWISVVMDTFVAVAHVLCLVNLLHRFRALDLGAHAQRMGTTICSIFAAVTLMSFINSAKNWIDEHDAKKLPYKIMEFFSDLGDLVALPWDLGMCYQSASSALAGGILMSISSLIWLAREATPLEGG